MKKEAFRYYHRNFSRRSYFALACLILVMNNLFLELFVQVFHMSVYPAKLLTECLLFVLSWVVQRYVIFQKAFRKQPSCGGSGV